MSNTNTIGYWSALGGIEVKEIRYEIDDKIVCVSNAWYGKPKTHTVRIYYTQNGRPYINLYGLRFHLDECIRA